MQGCTGGEPCPGLLSEDEPSRGRRSVKGGKATARHLFGAGPGQLRGASQTAGAPSPWDLVKVQMLFVGLG